MKCIEGQHAISVDKAGKRLLFLSHVKRMAAGRNCIEYFNMKSRNTGLLWR